MPPSIPGRVWRERDPRSTRTASTPSPLDLGSEESRKELPFHVADQHKRARPVPRIRPRGFALVAQVKDEVSRPRPLPVPMAQRDLALRHGAVGKGDREPIVGRPGKIITEAETATVPPSSQMGLGASPPVRHPMMRGWSMPSGGATSLP